MKKLVLLVILMASVYGFSQVDATIDRRKGRWVVGGGLGLAFSNGLSIQVNPDVGYRIDNVEFGASVGINYSSYNGDYYQKYKYTMWNMGPYLLYAPLSQIFFRGQYQYYTGKLNFEDNFIQDTNYSESALWLGGGYQDRIADHVYMRIGLMYNVLYDSGFDNQGRPNSIFSSGFLPIFGVSVGL